MEIFIQVKAVGKRKPVLEKIPYEISDSVLSLRDFLTEIVRIEVERYNEKEAGAQIIPYLTAAEIDERAEGGKVGFGRVYSKNRAELSGAIDNALQCVSDGLVRVFQNETEIERLDGFLDVKDGDCFTFIRLTFLAGRLW